MVVLSLTNTDTDTLFCTIQSINQSVYYAHGSTIEHSCDNFSFHRLSRVINEVNTNNIDSSRGPTLKQGVEVEAGAEPL